MDPITQGALGAIAAACLSTKAHARVAALLGAAAGMAPDLDVFIRSDSDPLLHLEYHRHFTHALAFIPVGALICAGILHWIVRKRLAFTRTYLYCFLGYATAGLLDACTSYGTQLLWPFSDQRISWSIISVVDPIFTAVLLLLLIIFLIKRRLVWPTAALGFCALYLAFGYFQQEQASAVQRQLTAERGHAAQLATVKPSIGNLLVWRSIYLDQDQYHVDAIRVSPFQSSRVYPGDSTPAFSLEEAFDEIPPGSVLGRDLQRFHHFSEGYLATLSDAPDFITDLRYSALPQDLAPLWGIRLPQATDQHVDFEMRRSIGKNERQVFLKMLQGNALDDSPADARH